MSDNVDSTLSQTTNLTPPGDVSIPGTEVDPAFVEEPLVIVAPCTIDELQVSSEAISLEAIAGLDSLKAAVQKLPELFLKATTFMSSKLNKDTVEQKHFYKPDTIRRIAKSQNYIGYSNVVIYKAVGQRVTALKLTEALTEAYTNVIQPLATSILPAVDRFTATMANNSNELRSSHFGDIVPKTILAAMEHSIVNIGQCFDPKDTRSQGLYKELYERNADLDTVSNSLTALNEDSFKISGKEILKRVESINAAMQILTNKIVENEIGYEFSPAVVKALADLCFNVARLVEFYSVYMYKLREQTIAVKDSVEALSVIK